MSGHSKWSSIKHKKGAADAKRGKVFTKLIKEITVAARMGGGDPNGNPRLRTAVDAAKAANMPKDNIERGIKKGTGELEGVNYEETNYEGYGPGGVAVLVECLTDKKNRTVADVKYVFERNGGSLGEPGCVAWMFEKKGLIVVEKASVDEESLFELALNSGAEDVRDDGDEFEIITDPGDFEAVKSAIEDAGIDINLAENGMIPKNTVKLEGKKAQQMLSLMEALEDNDDVSRVFANFDIPDEELEALG
ncbi:MAG: YebC/PmpR family DNA-binding transcriptional regulator [Desulfatiglandaceae bacterium]